VEVVYGVCESEARELIAPFAKTHRDGYPYLTLKLAMTLDGRIADRSGAARWITGEAARAEVQRLRRRADVMLVGAGTVCADDPSLLCRIGGGEKAHARGRGCDRPGACERAASDGRGGGADDRRHDARGRGGPFGGWRRRGGAGLTFAPDRAGVCR
jgi:hypothetical protein